MTKQEILDYFKDINQAYNNPNMHDSLAHMLDELITDMINAMLKEQDAVKPQRMFHNKERASFDNYLCECKNELYYRQMFCDVCGRSVK